MWLQAEEASRGREPTGQKLNLKHLGERESEIWPARGHRPQRRLWLETRQHIPSQEQGRGKGHVAPGAPLSSWHSGHTHARLSPPLPRFFLSLLDTHRPALRWVLFSVCRFATPTRMETPAPWEQVLRFVLLFGFGIEKVVSLTT